MLHKLVFSLFFVQTVSSLNVAVYINLVGKSHLTFVSSLIDLLNERGHNVDLLISRLNTGFEYEGATKARRVLAFEFNGTSPWLSKPKHLNDPFEDAPLFNLPQFYRINTELCRVGLQSGEALAFLQEGKYDVMLASQYEYCGMILAKAAGINSVIGYTATNILPTQAISTGLPNSPNWITSNLDSDKGSLSLWGRLKRLYRWAEFSMSSRDGLIQIQTELARDYFGQQFPDVEQLERNLDLVFINSNEIVEIPRVLSPKIVYIGGAATSPAKRVSEEFNGLLNTKYKGTVLISFGTQVPAKMISRRVKEAIIHSAKELSQYSFIFKYDLQSEDREMFSNVTNLHLADWVPQKDLLFDGRISAFVSHMGLNSLLESSQAGVPMVSIPLFADQGHNARCAARLGTSLVLEKTSFTGFELTDALRRVLEDGSFKTNANQIAGMLRNQPNAMKERFVQWTEFAATNKNLHRVFNLPEAEATFLSYYCFDLALLIISLFSTGLYVSYKTLVWLPKLHLK